MLPINHCQVILDGGTSMCSKNYFFTASLICTQTTDTIISCYARPVLIPVSCVPVEPFQLSESITTNLGVYKYQDTGEQFLPNEYIPDSS